MGLAAFSSVVKWACSPLPGNLRFWRVALPCAQGTVLIVPLPTALTPPTPYPTSPPEPPPKRCLDILNAALPWAALVLSHTSGSSPATIFCGSQHPRSQQTETVSRGHWWPDSPGVAWGSGTGARMWPPHTPGFSLLAALGPLLH